MKTQKKTPGSRPLTAPASDKRLQLLEAPASNLTPGWIITKTLNRRNASIRSLRAQLSKNRKSRSKTLSSAIIFPITLRSM